MGKKVNIKYENPVVQYQDNLLLNTVGDIWAYYQLKPFQINVANAQDKGTSPDWAKDIAEVAQYYMGQEEVNILESEFQPILVLKLLMKRGYSMLHLLDEKF
ncbi:hypothetical protein DIS12_03715 [Leuconostoc citreum]|uniref:hypothetical protein n=1 Tax=Leuconostoc citreum TaxID=33964 RepID=UPI0011234AB7|nr:hypothetical protein [Leuconostoc citreum]TOY70576.1 hypothetical protein DIS12_03715 [Leuconostoc citreum]